MRNLTILLLLGLSLVAACGIKGDPLTPPAHQQDKVS